MDTAKLIAIFLERGMAMQTFWGFYITVALGSIAFFGAQARTKKLALLISMAFIAFCYVNSQAIHAVSEQRNFLYDQLQAVAKSSSPVAASVPPWDREIAAGISGRAKPSDPDSVYMFHIGLDVAVLMAIWVLTFWPKPAGDTS